MIFVSASKFYVYLPCLDICLALEGAFTGHYKSFD